MNSKPKTTWIVTTVIALFAIVAGTYYSIRPKQQAENSNAAADVALTFNTPTISSNINTTLTPKIMINPTTNQVTAVEVNLSFDPNKVSINSITNTGVFTKTLTAPVINNTNGTAKFVFGVNATATQPPVPITAVSEVASLNLSTKSIVGDATVTISNNSIATAKNLDTSVLGIYGNMIIHVLGVATPTATSTASPMPTPTASPSPTPTRSPSPTPTQSSQVNNPRMLIPLYIYPSTSAYAPVVNANTYHNIDVILNPNNGASTAIDQNYVNGISQLRAGSVGIYGYTYTGWGSRTISVVKADIDNWKNWYGVDGIFLDEGANTAAGIPYYTDLYNYIKSKGMKVIINPGTSTIEGYMSIADSNCIYESDPTKALVIPTWSSSYSPAKFCVLQYAATVADMRTTVSYAKSHNVGYVYVTDATAHFWSSLPPYLLEEATLLAGGVISTTPSPVPTITYPAWDVNTDTFTNIIDIGLIVDNYGSSAPSNPRADVNGDGAINIIDIGIVVDHYR